MQRPPTRQPEPLMPLQATANELIAVGAAITTYTTMLARTPQSAAEHAETIKLLDRFQRRLTQQIAADPVLRGEEPPCHNSSI